MIAIETEMPKNCIECEEKDIRFVNHCPLIFDAKADIERHPSCPLKEIVTCKDCNNHGINKEHPDIDGARYCSVHRIYTGYDYYCGDGERRK